MHQAPQQQARHTRQAQHAQLAKVVPGMGLRRHVAVGIFGLVGSGLAFFAGAKIGSRLDHQTKTATVAHMQVPTAQAPEDQPPPSAVAVVK